MYKQILQTYLHTFLLRIVERIWFTMKTFFLWFLNLEILITFTLDDLLMLLGENWWWSLLGPKGLSPSAKQYRNSCSGPPPVYQDLSTAHDWPFKKAIVNLRIRLKGNWKRTSGNSLSPLGPCAWISKLLRRRYWPGLDYVYDAGQVTLKSRGVLIGILCGDVQPSSPNPDPISDQNQPFSDQISKIHTCFQNWL